MNTSTNNLILASPPKENHKIEIRCNNGVNLNNINILKKLKMIEEKLRSKLNSTANRVTKPKKLDNNSTISMKTTKKSGITSKSNKTSKLSTKLPPTMTTVRTTTDAIVDDYIIAEDFLNKELSELELSEEYAQLEERLNKVKESASEVPSQIQSGRKLDKNQQAKSMNNNADHEWNKALGIVNEHLEYLNHKDKDLLPALLPVEGQNLGNNQLVQFNARSGAAAQKQDISRKDGDATPGSNTGKIIYPSYEELWKSV